MGDRRIQHKPAQPDALATPGAAPHDAGKVVEFGDGEQAVSVTAGRRRLIPGDSGSRARGSALPLDICGRAFCSSNLQVAAWSTDLRNAARLVSHREADEFMVSVVAVSEWADGRM